jgi:hypothetical protein
MLAAGALVAAALLAPAAGADPSGRVSFPGALPAVPQRAALTGSLPPGRTMTIDVMLAVPDPSALASFVAAVSTPSSPDYRHYLAPGQFGPRFGPGRSAIVSVRTWLAGQGLAVGPTSPDGLLIPATGTVAEISGAFATTMSAVKLASGGAAYTATTAPSVPAALAPSVATIVGLSNLARWHNDLRTSTTTRPATAPVPAVSANSSGPQACAVARGMSFPSGPLTMDELASAYSFSPLYAQGRLGGGVTIGIYELEPYEPSDISTFFSCYGISTSVTNVAVDGGAGTGPGVGEASLDIEDAAALAPQAHIVVYSGPNSIENGPGSGPFDTLDKMATDDAAQVLSTSWGVCEPENIPAGNGPGSAAAAEATVFAEMAAQGQTMVAASGDSGSEACWLGGPPPLDPNDSLQVDDPAAQPDVVGVGGTALPNGTPTGEGVWNDCQGSGSESCADFINDGAGGGGISANWDMPSWQVPVENGQSSGIPCANGSGNCREVPDVSADAAPNTGYITYNSGPAQGGWGVVGGTSAAAPLWAAAFALLDEGCASPVGMATPALYTLGEGASSAFNDVTVAGNNDLTSTGGGDYPTGTGYDMATGWGSPNVAALLSALQPAGGCPVVTGLSSSHGPVQGGGTLTVSGSSLATVSAVHFGPGLEAQVLSASATAVTVVIPAAPAPEAVDVTVTTPAGTSGVVPGARYVFGSPRNGLGYWLNASDGGIFAFGNANFYGSMGGQPLNEPIVGLAATPDDDGYWEVASDGGIFAFGNANFYGSMGGKPLNRPIVGLAATPDGRGYWEVASDGGLFAFGDAQFYGSMGGRPLNEPIVGLAATPDGRGYWEVASDGGLFAFGDAQFFGSMGGQPLNEPIVGLGATLDGRGYWEVASDGGIFSFGDAQFYGSTGAAPLNRPIVGLASTPDSGGYWEVASDGGIFSFGDANFFGSTGATPLNNPIVGMADT